MVALGWTRAAIAGRAEIGARLQRSLRELWGSGIAGVERKLSDIGRDVHHQPMPKAAAGGRVRVEARDGEAFCSCRRSRPGEVWRLIAAGATESEIGGQNVCLPEVIAVLKAVACDRESHGRPPTLVHSLSVLRISLARFGLFNHH